MIFDLGGLSISTTHSMIASPSLDAAISNNSTAAHAKIRLIWSAATSGDWDSMFKYSVDADDFNDTDLTTDISYSSVSTGWYTGNLMNAVGQTAASTTVANKQPQGLTAGATSSSHTLDTSVTGNIAKDLLQHIAYDIFGAEGGLDMFSNEATLLSNLKTTGANSVMAGIETAINTKFTESNTAGALGTKSSSNLAHAILSKIMQDSTRSATAITAFAAAGGRNVDIKVPLAALDEIIFNVTIQPNFTSTNSDHGIGANAVGSRTYKVTLVLAA